MRLALLHPDVAFRDCKQCVEFVFEETGVNAGQISKDISGKPIKRPRGTHPPCKRSGTSCPKGTAEDHKELSPENWQAWQFYKRCKLLNRWPEDAIVIEMGIILDTLMEDIRQSRQWEMMMSLTTSLSVPRLPGK